MKQSRKEEIRAPSVNATAASLLGFLHEKPMTGWDLVATARVRIGEFWSITASQVYRELAAMAKDGLIVAGRKGPRDRQPYTITPSGRIAFRAWIHRNPPPEAIRFPLLLTIAFGSHLEPDALAAMLAEHRALHVERRVGYESKLNDPASPVHQNTHALACLQFGLHYEKAVLNWFEALPTILQPKTKKLKAPIPKARLGGVSDHTPPKPK